MVCCPICLKRCCVVGHRCSRTALARIDRDHRRALLDDFEGDDGPEEPGEEERLADGFRALLGEP